MLIEPYLGWPQIAAIAVLIQRGLEELHSARNTSRLIHAGGREVGVHYYPVIAVTHLSWIAAIFFLLPPTATVVWPMVVLYLALQIMRYWAILSLGKYWTHRIITLDDAPLVQRGPYRYISHPNYAVTVAETLLLPWIFEAWALGLIMTATWSSVLAYKIRLEDEALARRRELPLEGG